MDSVTYGVFGLDFKIAVSKAKLLRHQGKCFLLHKQPSLLGSVLFVLVINELSAKKNVCTHFPSSKRRRLFSFFSSRRAKPNKKKTKDNVAVRLDVFQLYRFEKGDGLFFVTCKNII